VCGDVTDGWCMQYEEDMIDIRNLDEKDVDVKEMGLKHGLEHREFVGEISDCQFLIAPARCK